MLGDVATAKINPARSILNREALVNGAGMTAAIAHIEHYARGETSRVERQHGRRVEEKLRHLELVKEHSRRAQPILDRVIGRLRQQHRVLSDVDLELVEHVTPDLLHVVPVLDNAVIHRVLQLQNALEFFLRDQKAI